ncbi:hypothetical protein PTE31013_00896 [Pandoraea terrigena]|uniref:Uncharacterized protein n=1 Tax=Pandoraea terrigena TaxID=2508292 RepID=A0A5E4SPM9_9BURK|nr:hypothetical protein PTE31013_00896 [Pandoraea terrigena]
MEIRKALPEGALRVLPTQGCNLRLIDHCDINLPERIAGSRFKYRAHVHPGKADLAASGISPYRRRRPATRYR